MALRREIHEETGLTEYRIIGALGTYAYLYGGISHIVNVYLVECSMFDGEATPTSRNDGDRFIRDVYWLKVNDALHSLIGDERVFVMKALGIPEPKPAVEVIETSKKPPLPAIHFLKRPTYPRPSLSASPSDRPRPR
jgi:8-oxo-dGTP pyrophosphatase MutT (NUDIX family)